ncbi:MAG: bifunctional demethylmenaquinone methyltransferase/2-methoxy-6-polyprenyl-1,4-benzoquinol methylase UbiE [Desulfobacterales bacterium]|nr:bifunctional demethylmenaquinone methyltransferase/2-methoxy-6-polyprenyl-1,4-benzoquinol methylase UbiE [Desulfobacterales bacterium]
MNQVREMFGRIAIGYDLMNRVISIGQDRKWRSYLVQMTHMTNNSKMLDIGCGTGKIAFEAKKRYPLSQIFGIDITIEMLKVAINRIGSEKIEWSIGDAEALPFGDNTFDAVTSGYLIRNVKDIRAAIKEQIRVVKEGGRIVCLETCPPPNNFLKPYIQFYLRHIIPFLGQIIVKDRSAYTYLPTTTQKFLSPERVVDIMKELGLVSVSFKRFMFGTQVVIYGIKSTF